MVRVSNQVITVLLWVDSDVNKVFKVDIGLLSLIETVVVKEHILNSSLYSALM